MSRCYICYLNNLEHGIVYQKVAIGTTIGLPARICYRHKGRVTQLATTGLAVYRFGWELLLALRLSFNRYHPNTEGTQQDCTICL